MKFLIRKNSVSALFLVFIWLTNFTSVSCADQKNAANVTAQGPVENSTTSAVTWYQGFDLRSYLKDERLAKTLKDIKRQLQSKWEHPYQVYSEDDSVERSVQSCEEFFNAKKDKLYPASNVERGPYSYVGLYCYAARLILEGKPAAKSYIENLKLDAEIARHLPAEVEYRINPKSPRHTSGSWADVEKVKATKVTNEEVEFSSKGAIHYVRPIATGDFNGDGVRDILFFISHNVKEGTHFENYLYIMTRTEPNAVLKVVKRYAALEE